MKIAWLFVAVLVLGGCSMQISNNQSIDKTNNITGNNKAADNTQLDNANPDVDEALKIVDDLLNK